MSDKPKIYVFSAMENGREGVCYAMAQVGTVLGSHFCSSEGFAPGDLGVTEGFRPDRHETYKKHYPDGYEMEFIKASNHDNHVGLQEALKLNEVVIAKLERDKDND